MGRRIPTGILIWSLTRFTKNDTLWDRVCFTCKQATPVFEYAHRDEQDRPTFSYLCEDCAQKKLAEWLESAASPDDVHPGHQLGYGHSRSVLCIRCAPHGAGQSCAT